MSPPSGSHHGDHDLREKSEEGKKTRTWMLRECGESRAKTKPVANFEKEYMMATAKKATAKKPAAKKPAAKKTAAKKPAAKKKTTAKKK